MPKRTVDYPIPILAAADAVSKCLIGFHEDPADPCGGPIRDSTVGAMPIPSFTRTDAMVWLCRSGLRNVLLHVEAALAQTGEELALQEDFRAFFHANPMAREARAANFAPSSRAGRWMEEHERGTAAWDEGLPMGFTREQAGREFDAVNQQTMGLIEAKGALQRAIAIVTPRYRDEVLG